MKTDDKGKVELPSFEEYNKLWPEDSPFQNFWTSTLNFCGCYSDEIFKLTYFLLKNLYEAKLNSDSFFYTYKDKTEAEKNLQELILHVFDSKNLTEHGTSVRGGWLTDEGLKVCVEIWEKQ